MDFERCFETLKQSGYCGPYLIVETIILRGEYIKLGQALKAAGMVESGVEAKEVIQEGLVMVNGETDTRRGRKLYGGDIVLFDGEEIRIEG